MYICWQLRQRKRKRKRKIRPKSKKEKKKKKYDQTYHSTKEHRNQPDLILISNRHYETDYGHHSTVNIVSGDIIM